ncbi:hypothetical protein MMC21_007607 [Puttea exsequens]|nr:hypothetical protein [Puttea exsequens]
MEALEVKLTQSIHNIREALDEAGMRYDDQEAFFDRCPKFKEMIEAILNIPRGSIMRDESSRKTNMLIRQNRTKSEETFFNKVFGSIVPNTHTVDGKKRDHEGKIEQVVKNYHEDDSLDYAEKPRFSVGFVPGKTYRKKVKEFGLTEPVPDRVYGTRKPLFKKKDNGPPLPEWLKAMKSLNTHMDWPFGIFENKSCKIAIAEAENQALRDGGAVVNSRLKLKWYVHGRENQPCGADEEIFAFSVCWGPDFVRMFVHWFEKISNEEEYFHMNKVGQYFIDDKEHQGIMRKRIHNIFDFGLFKYVTVAEDTYKKAVAKYRQVGDNSETQSLADAAALESTVDTEEGDVERQ